MSEALSGMKGKKFRHWETPGVQAVLLYYDKERCGLELTMKHKVWRTIMPTLDFLVYYVPVEEDNQ
jgi:hypothetical protein